MESFDAEKEVCALNSKVKTINIETFDEEEMGANVKMRLDVDESLLLPLKWRRRKKSSRLEEEGLGK